MDAADFDALTRFLSAGLPRRTLVALIAGALTPLLGGRDATAHNASKTCKKLKGDRKKACLKKAKKHKATHTTPAPPSSCVPESPATTCAGRCGTVADSCGQSLTCSCPACQTCRGGVCVADPGQQGTVCAGTGATTAICCNDVCCDGCCGSDGSCGACLAFLTSTKHTGNLGGLAGADAICNTRAHNRLLLPPLPGTYTAWLAIGPGPGESPATGRFRQSQQPYRLVNGQQIAPNWAGLVDGALDRPLELTEIGTTLFEEDFPWTNTRHDGTVGDARSDCNDWTSDSEDLYGWLGNHNRASGWSVHFSFPCNARSTLYCFQQR